jgi:hypothetical protein
MFSSNGMFLFRQVAEQRYFGREYIDQDKSVPPAVLHRGKSYFRHAMQGLV